MEGSAEERAAWSQRGFGIAGSLSPELIRALAKAAEDAGYHTFWTNDGPQGEGLAALREAAAVTSRIRLAVGAIPLDRVTPEQIAARLTELALPTDRLIVGIGSGGQPGGLQRVRDGVAMLRRATTAPLVVAAMGPKMSALASDVADGILLDWATPAYAQRTAAIVAECAAASRRPRPWLVSYVFTALGSAAGARLQEDAAYYAAIPAYVAHFQRMEADPLETTATGDDSRTLQRSLDRFAAVLDETVVRAVAATAAFDDYLAVLHAAAPA